MGFAIGIGIGVCFGGDNAPANQPPTCAIVQPPGDGPPLVVGTEYQLEGSWTDADGNVVSGRWLFDGVALGAATIAPGTATRAWTPGAPSAGADLVLEVTDDDGAVTQSAPRAVIINSPPTVAITSPAEGASYDWAEIASYSAEVVQGTDAITSVTLYRVSPAGVATSLGAAVHGAGNTWTLANHQHAEGEIGASGDGWKIRCRVVAGTFTVDHEHGVTVVDPFVALSATWWDFTQNTTIVDASCNALASWTSTGLTGWAGSVLTEDGGTSEHEVHGTSTVVAGPATMTVRITPTNRAWFRVALGAATCFFDCSGAGTVGTASGCTGAIAQAGASYDCTITVAAATAAAVPKVNAASDGSTISYAGGSSAAGTVVSATVTQRRASQVSARRGALGTLAQATAANQPFLWTGSAWSQSGGLWFNGGQCMTLATAAIAQPHGWVACAKPAQADEFTSVRMLADGNTTSRNAFYTAVGGAWILYAGTIVTTDKVATRNTLQVFSAAYSGASSYSRVNGVQSADVNPSTSSLDDIVVGAVQGGAGFYWIGPYMDLVSVNTATAASLSRLEKVIAMLRGVTLS